jgi:two-component system NtrC family sensor kinase
VKGKPLGMLAPPDRQNEIPKVLEDLRRGETVGHFETMAVRKDGTAFPVEIAASPIRDAMGRTIGASTIGRDISVRKRREEELSRLASVVGQVVGVPTTGCDVTKSRDLADMFRQAQKMQTVGQLAGGVGA